MSYYSCLRFILLTGQVPWCHFLWNPAPPQEWHPLRMVPTRIAPSQGWHPLRMTPPYMRLASGPYSSYWNCFLPKCACSLVCMMAGLQGFILFCRLAVENIKCDIIAYIYREWSIKYHSMSYTVSRNYVIKGSFLEKLRQTLQTLQTGKTLQTRGRQVSHYEQRNLTWKVSSNCTGVLNGGSTISQMEAGCQTIILAKFSRKLHQIKIIRGRLPGCPRVRQWHHQK